MTLGERLKQLRMEKNWTQPQTAELIGIEQSYLSKLENDKSLPSAEIFTAILKAFSLDAQAFLENINLALLDRQLMQIPAIAACFTNQQQGRIVSIKKWLFSSALASVLGLTLIVAGYMGLVFANKQYTYVSPGVTKPGESRLIFDNWRQTIESASGPGAWEAGAKARSDKQQEIVQRLVEDYLLTNDYKGEIFVVPAEGGSRTYKLMSSSQDEKDMLRKENRLLILVGFLLTFGGSAGFFIEYRLRSAHKY